MTLPTLRRLYATLIGFIFVFSLMVLAGAPAAVAQTAGGATLRGTVKDPAGAVVPDASVVLVNERTKDERKTTTNSEGLYVFTAVTPDTYTLRVEAKGFKTLNQSKVVLEANSVRGNDISLELGQPSETVTIQGGGAVDQLQTETGARE